MWIVSEVCEPSRDGRLMQWDDKTVRQHRAYKRQLAAKMGKPGAVVQPMRFHDAETGDLIYSNVDAFKPEPFFVPGEKILPEEAIYYCPTCHNYLPISKTMLGVICSHCKEYINLEKRRKQLSHAK